MARTANKQKQDYAKLLFTRERLTQKEVAQRVGVSEQTLSKWAREENWEELRNWFLISREEELNRIYKQMSELNEAILEREKGKRYATNSEADILSKLATAARQLESEASLTEIINTFTEFLDWLRKIDLEKAKEIVRLQDSFVKFKLKVK